MRFNPFNLKKNDTVILDADLHKLEVEIVEFSRKKKRAIIKIYMGRKYNERSWYEFWNVMTRRLTPITKNK